MSEHIAIYAGSFDPITSGHLDVVSRARGMFDSIIVGIGHNPDKPALFHFDERVEMAQSLINELVEKNPDSAPVRVEQYSGLTVDFARAAGGTVLLRGIRNVTDLAVETQLAITNRQVADMETVFIITGEQYAFTSSSLIRQIAALGGGYRPTWKHHPANGDRTSQSVTRRFNEFPTFARERREHGVINGLENCLHRNIIFSPNVE